MGFSATTVASRQPVELRQLGIYAAHMPNGQLVNWLDSELAKRKRKATTVAVAAGLDRSIVSKWRGGQEAKADDVRAFAVAIGAPVLEAFFAAEFLQAEDAEVKWINRPVSDLDDDELVAEISRRMKGARGGVADQKKSSASSEGDEIEEVSWEELEQRARDLAVLQDGLAPERVAGQDTAHRRKH